MVLCWPLKDGESYGFGIADFEPEVPCVNRAEADVIPTMARLSGATKRVSWH